MNTYKHEHVNTLNLHANLNLNTMNNLRNKVQLIGKLGANPEMRVFDNGQKLARISLATKDIFKNAKGEKVVETQWHKLVAWGKTAENIEVFLKKGNEVAFMGRLQHRTYEDKNGVKRRITEVSVNEFMLLSGATKQEKEVAEPQPQAAF